MAATKQDDDRLGRIWSWTDGVDSVSDGAKVALGLLEVADAIRELAKSRANPEPVDRTAPSPGGGIAPMPHGPCTCRTCKGIM